MSAEGEAANQTRPQTGRRWLAALVLIIVFPAIAFAIGQAVHSKYQGDLMAAIEQDIGRPLTTAERADLTIDALCREPDLRGKEVCFDLSIATIVDATAVVALVVGLTLLAFLAGLRRAVGRDRWTLLRVFRPSLYIVLVALVVLVIADGLIALGAVYLGLGVFLGRIYPALLFAIGLGVLIAAVGIVRAAARVRLAARSTVFGRRLDPEKQPQLYDLVQGLAADVGTQPPDQIVAGLDPNFFVTEVQVESLDGTAGGRTLYVSLPLSHILSVPELRAVLGHEMGHFRGDDSRFSREFYPVYRGASEATGALASGTGTGTSASIALLPAELILALFIDAFALPERAISRDRELAADQVGTDSASARDLASALVKLHAFTDRWGPSLEALVDGARGGKPLANAGILFVESVRSSAKPAALEGLDTRVLPHPTDSHPPLSQRLEALHLTVDDVADAALEVAPAPAASDLINRAADIETELTATLTARFAQAIGVPQQEPTQAVAP
jgi:Zn-dependent protease with chaperone function